MSLDVDPNDLTASSNKVSSDVAFEERYILTEGCFNFSGVCDFTFDGWASHLGVIVSGLSGR